MRNSISIMYRRVGDSHVFNSPELQGFHVGGPSLDKAFEAWPEALSAHVSALYNSPTKCVLNANWQAFESMLDNSGSLPALKARTRVLR